MSTDSHHIAASFEATYLDRDAHPEDVFVSGFIAHVRARVGDGPLACLAFDYAQDALDGVGEVAASSGAAVASFGRAIEVYATGSSSILAPFLASFAVTRLVPCCPRQPLHRPIKRRAA